jgi:acetylglutamate kinase
MDQSKLVIKFGGNEADDPHFVAGLVEAVQELQNVQPVIVHGGGKEIARLQTALNIVPQAIEGLRVTDSQSLDVAEMVLSGLVNKRLVARLVSAGVPAIGLSGVDGGLIRVEKMIHPAGDLGWVGRVVDVNITLLSSLLEQGLLAVISPISLGLDGHTYNVNADHAAVAVAVALRAAQLVFVSNVPGVLINGQVVACATARQAEEWIASGQVYGGMVPKVRSALEGVAAGIREVRITHLAGLRAGTGTTFVPGTE